MSIEITHDWDDEDYNKTLEEAFAVYRTACYGNADLHPTQLREVRQAFFSGMHYLNTRLDWCPDILEHALRDLCLPVEGNSTGSNEQ